MTWTIRGISSRVDDLGAFLVVHEVASTPTEPRIVRISRGDAWATSRDEQDPTATRFDLVSAPGPRVTLVAPNPVAVALARWLTRIGATRRDDSLPH